MSLFGLLNGVLTGKELVVTKTDVATTTTITALDSSTGFVKFTGSTATDLQGITAGKDGQSLTLYNSSSAIVTIEHQNTGASAANRIITSTGSALNMSAASSCQLIYDGTAQRWIVISSGAGNLISYNRYERKIITVQDTIPDLLYTPQDVTSVVLFLGSLAQRYGGTLDYTVSGVAITWNYANNNTHINPGDNVWVFYSSTVDVSVPGSPAIKSNFSTLKRNSTTEFACGAANLSGGFDYIGINDEVIDLSADITCATSDNLITATGADAGSGPSASTLYYAYLSNSSASYAPNSLRLSATSPTNDGYLGSGNANNWRFVGAVYLDASTQIANSWNLCGFNEKLTSTTFLSGDITRSSGGSGQYDCMTTYSHLVVIPNTKVVFSGWNRSKYDISDNQAGIYISVDGVIKMTYTERCESTGRNSCFGTYSEVYSVVDEFPFKTLYYYDDGASTLTITDASDTGIAIARTSIP